MKIVVRGANWIGDAVMTLPALAALREAYPDAHVTLLTRPWAEGVFRDLRTIDEIRLVSPGGIWSESAELRRERPDAVILFTNSFKTALVARLAGIPKRIGYAAERRGFLLTDRVKIPAWKSSRHESEYYLNLVEHFTGTSADRRPVSLDVSQERKDAAKALLSQADLNAGSGPVVALGPGSTNSRAKRWPAANFASVAQRLTSELGARVVILGSSEEQSVASDVLSHTPSTITDLSGKTDLEQATAILSVCDLFISNDMGLAHISAALGTPTAVIFGPTNEDSTRPLGPRVSVIREHVECSPCMLRDCPIDHRCMTRITPQRVFETAAKMLDTHSV